MCQQVLAAVLESLNLEWFYPSVVYFSKTTLLKFKYPMSFILPLAIRHFLDILDISFKILTTVHEILPITDEQWPAWLQWSIILRHKQGQLFTLLNIYIWNSPVRYFQMCCLAEHPQARVVYDEVVGAADKDASRTRQKGAWPVQEAYLVSARSSFMVLVFKVYSYYLKCTPNGTRYWSQIVHKDLKATSIVL